MNKPIPDAETQLRMAEYNSRVVAEIVSLFERPGMPRPRSIPSIDQEHAAREYKAASKLEELCNAFRLAVMLDVLPNTDLRNQRVRDFLDVLDSEMPDFLQWRAEIREGHRG